VTLDAIEPACVGSNRHVPTGFEQLQWLAMTLTAHLERGGCIRSCDKAAGVRTGFFGLRRIAAVAAVAPNAYATMGAGFIYRHNLVCRGFLAGVAGDATVLGPGSRGSCSQKAIRD
jgi:hypothetical protein